MSGDISTVECVVQRIQQSTDYYCGAACSAMVFSRFDMWVDQDRAYQAIRAGALEPNAWYSDPQGVASCLNAPQFEPDKIEFVIADFSTGDTDSILQRIYQSIAVTRMPCPVLVKAGMHWVIVDGVRCAPRDDGGVDVLGLFVTDPFRTEPERKLIPVDIVAEQYLTPIRYGVRWRGKLAMITDAAPAAVKVSQRVQMGGGAGFVSASDSAIAGLTFLGFSAVLPTGGKAFEMSNEPILVRSLDTGAEIYSLAPIDASGDPELARPLYVAIEKGANRFLEVCLNARSLSLLSDRATSDLLAERFPQAHSIQVDADFYWKECRELRSRFAVVKRATVDGAPVYVLPGGEVLTSLTVSTLGGA